MARNAQQELPAKWEDWKAPWEVDEDGEDIAPDDQKIDGTRLKKYLFGLLKDKGRLKKQNDEVTAERDELEEKIAEATDPKKIEELQAKVKKAEEERDAAKSGTALENLKLQIALEKGLTAKQVKRLVGTTREELEADADELLEEIGGKTSSKEEPGNEEEGNETKPSVRSRPQPAGRPPAREKGEDGALMDPDKFMEQYQKKSSLGY